MTTLTAAHTSHRPAPTTTTTQKPSPTSPPSTAAKLGDCGSQEAKLTQHLGLQDCPTTFYLPNTSPTVVVLPPDDDHQHLTPPHTVVDPDDDVNSFYLNKWRDCLDPETAYPSELDAIAAACERMQQRLLARTTAAPTTQSTATTQTQQSTPPSTQRCTSDDEDSFSSVIDKLVEACDRMQQRWPTITTTVEPPPPTTDLKIDCDPTTSECLATLASLDEFANSDTAARLDGRPPTPDATRLLSMSFHDIRVLQMNVMVKIMDMIGVIHDKIDLLTAATRPQQSPLSIMNVTLLPAPPLSSTYNLPPSQKTTVFGLLKPKGSFTQASLHTTQLAYVSHTCPYKRAIPAKPPFHRDGHPLTLFRAKDSMRPP